MSGVEFHNPWRESLENCISGDNYLRSREYSQLIEELDELYKYRNGSHPALQEAYADGRSDEAEASAAPDLLEALEEALQTAEFEKHPERPWHAKARAAISKAKGQ